MRKKMQRNDNQITEIKKERDEWEKRYEVKEQEYRRDVEKYKDLNLDVGTISNIARLSKQLSMANQAWKSDVTIHSKKGRRSKYGDVGSYELHQGMLDAIPSSRSQSADETQTALSIQIDELLMKTESLHSNVHGVSGLDIRSVRLSLWCVVFWMFSIAELAFYGHLLNEDRTDVGLLLYVIADLILFLGVLATMNHIHLDSSIFGKVGGALFLIAGILHLAATSVYVGPNCSDHECVVIHFGTDFMAQFLSLYIGIDVLTSKLETRIYRVLGLSLLLGICTIMIGSVWEHESTVLDNELRGTATGLGAVGFWLSGVISVILFLGLSAMVVFGIDDGNMDRNAITYTLNATIGFTLLDSAGMLFYALPGYQVLLMLATATILAYEMLFL